ncbi:helix-turn-helix transcriptional regulator [Sphingobacterium sp. LRF_L2]|uniref:helix-turn-helix transcriptional regulator n=1 Tax=Sphingobacterium sp. LRF_L2 TaxID=3369421 RepID=UPI003F643FA7
MHIYSKIVELDQELGNLIIDDSYTEEAPIETKSHRFENESLLVEAETLYTAGLHIVESHIKTKSAFSNKWFTNGPHIRFFFYLKGNSMVKNGAGNQTYDHDIGMLQRNFLDSNGGGGTALLKADDEVHHIIVKMSRDFYLQLLANESWIGEDAFHDYIVEGIPENRPNETLYMDLKMLRILQDILSSSDIQHHRFHFLKLKLRELLFSIHQLTHFGPAAQVSTTSPSYLDMMEKVRGYLILHLDNPPNLPQLAKKFALNEKKLKQDFKLAYGKTIYAFVIQERMEKAKKLLFENYNVNELATLLGYQSVSHFIKVFKSYHGHTPKEALLHFKAIAARSVKGIQIIASSSFLIDCCMNIL